MWTDPIVEEVRREREEYAAQFNFDLHAIVRDVQQREQENGREVVTRPPHRPLTIVKKEQGVGQGR